VGRDRVVGVATRYGVDGPGIESRWGRDFPHPFRPDLEPTQPTIQWVPGPSWGLIGRIVALTTHPHLPPSGGVIFWTHPMGSPSLLQEYLVPFLRTRWPRLKYGYTSTSPLWLTCYGIASVYVCVFSHQNNHGLGRGFGNQKSKHSILLPIIDVLQSKMYYAKGSVVKNLCFAVMWT
jgi:hypothetical protein